MKTSSALRTSIPALLIGAVALTACSAGAGDTSSASGSSEEAGPLPGSVAIASIGGAEEDPSAIKPEAVHGGTGGQDQWMGCGNITGINGNWGNYIDQLILLCDGDSRWGAQYVGKGNGYAQLYQSCPEGYVLTGLQGRAHTYVDALGIVCTNKTTGEKFYWNPIQGGGGGDYFAPDECPWGKKITSFHVKAANWLDRIEPYCSDW